MALTDVKIRNAKAADKQVKLFDGGGLFLLVVPAGGKLWRLKYRFEGKEKLLALGNLPLAIATLVNQIREKTLAEEQAKLAKTRSAPTANRERVKGGQCN